MQEVTTQNPTAWGKELIKFVIMGDTNGHAILNMTKQYNEQDFSFFLFPNINCLLPSTPSYKNIDKEMYATQ